MCCRERSLNSKNNRLQPIVPDQLTLEISAQDDIFKHPQSCFYAHIKILSNFSYDTDKSRKINGRHLGLISQNLSWSTVLGAEQEYCSIFVIPIPSDGKRHEIKVLSYRL
jgi:hypothetical protein